MTAGRYDAIVVGLGVMGSAVAAALARSGLRVLGLDRFEPPHAFGSSHGETRIIRTAYFEDPLYVPLAQRAFGLWRDLERRAGSPLLRMTGALMLGPPDAEVVRGTHRSVREHGLAHTVLDAAGLRDRFPFLSPPPSTVGIHEENAGVLHVERCVRALMAEAREAGAELRGSSEVRSWREVADGVEVETESGRIRAEQLVLAVGPWITELVPGLPLVVERQPVFWFDPPGKGVDSRDGLRPVFVWELDEERSFYGIPDERGGGIKVARHHGGETGRLQELHPDPRPSEEEEVREFLVRYLPSTAGALRASSVCRYTNTPGGDFLIDRLPGAERVLLVSPCSGHGFKFAPVVGELVRDLILGAPRPPERARFRVPDLPGHARPDA